MAKTHRNSLQPGYTLHWYEIKEILGQGGFGITYLAHDNNLHKEVAIKEYLPIEMAVREKDYSVNPVTENHDDQFKWGLDRFLKEARTLAQFDHPNIVRVHAVFEDNNTGYMVMNYERGVSLAEKLKGQATLGEEELSNILAPLLFGLEQMHRSGFIHRDIKPDNIFIRNDGSPVLLDFGSARQALGGQTKTLTSLVTPGYAPFEQYYAKSDEQGPWTDIYGLGATVYRAVTGVAPMDAMERSNALIRRKHDNFVSSVDFAGMRYSDRFLQAVDHALNFNIEDRPQSISEWREEFGFPETPVTGPVKEHVPTQPGTFFRMPTSSERTFATGRPISRKTEQLEEKRPSRMPVVIISLLLLIGLGFFFAGDIYKAANEWQKGNTIQTKLSDANTHMAAQRFTQPTGNNALALYQQVLVLAPNNAEARLGLQSIADHLVSKARTAVLEGDLTNAKNLLDEAKDILPNSANIKLAMSEYKQAKKEKDEKDAEVKAREEEQKRISEEKKRAEEKARAEKIARLVYSANQYADKGQVQETLAQIEQIKSMKAEEQTVIDVADRLRVTLNRQLNNAAAEAKQAMADKNTKAAREALAKAKEIKSQLDGLNLPQ